MAGQVAPYGTWASPITAQSIARGSVTPAEPALAAGSVWWLEGRPSEGGRQVLMRDGRELLPHGFSARTRVHEYGGGAYGVDERRFVFSNDQDGRLYEVAGEAEPQPITPEPAQPRSLRYADFFVAGDAAYCVRESHETDGEPANEIVRITDGAVE